MPSCEGIGVGQTSLFKYSPMLFISYKQLFQDLDTMLEKTDHILDDSCDRLSDCGDCPTTVVKNPKYKQSAAAESCPPFKEDLFGSGHASDRQGTYDTDYAHYSHRDKCVRRVESRDNSKPIRRSGEARRQKYCNRELLQPPDSQYLMSDWEKCEFCSGRADRTGADGAVCYKCEKLGLELDQLIGASAVTGWSFIAFKNDL